MNEHLYKPMNENVIIGYKPELLSEGIVDKIKSLNPFRKKTWKDRIMDSDKKVREFMDKHKMPLAALGAGVGAYYGTKRFNKSMNNLNKKYDKI